MMESKRNAMFASWHLKVQHDLYFKRVAFRQKILRKQFFCNIYIAVVSSNEDEEGNKQTCSKETVWDEIDVYDNNNYNNDTIMGCDNSTIGQWNKACMCTGPDVNGSWIPCNSATKSAFGNTFMLYIVVLNFMLFRASAVYCV